MKRLFVIIFMLFTFVNGAYALPNCQSDQSVSWNSCQGTFTFADGDKYVGEWKDGSLIAEMYLGETLTGVILRNRNC